MVSADRIETWQVKRHKSGATNIVSRKSTTNLRVKVYSNEHPPWSCSKLCVVNGVHLSRGVVSSTTWSAIRNLWVALYRKAYFFVVKCRNTWRGMLTPLFGKYTRCSVHGHFFMRLQHKQIKLVAIQAFRNFYEREMHNFGKRGCCITIINDLTISLFLNTF